MDFINQFKSASRVSTPIIAVRTFDASSAIGALKGSYKDPSKVPFVNWDCVIGAKPLNDSGRKGMTQLLGQNPEEATVSLKNTLWFASTGWGLTAPARDCVLFINNAHLHWEHEPAVIQGIWNLRNIFKANGHMLILLIAPGATLPKELQNDVLVIDEPLPTREKLEQIVVENHKLHDAPLPDKDDLSKAVDAVVGLPAFGAEQSISMCIASKTKKLDMQELWHKKREIIRQTPGLSLITPKIKLADIGGNDQVIKFYRQLFEGPRAPKIIIFMDEVEKMFAGTGSEDGNKAELAGAFQSWSEDNGIRGGALVGIPGVGKTRTFEGLCGEYDCPGIVFDVAAMQDKHVGESGARLRNAMATVLSVAGGKGSDVFALATSNGMDNMPLGMRSRFGFAPTFFVDEPSRKEREAIWSIQTSSYNLPNGDRTFDDDHWTGREIKQCCEKAEALGISVNDAAQWVVPITVSESDRIKGMRYSAHNKYLSAAVEGPYQYNEAMIAKHEEALALIDENSRRIKE